MIYLIDPGLSFAEIPPQLEGARLSVDNQKHLKALRADRGDEVAFLNLEGKAAVYIVKDYKPLILEHSKNISQEKPALKTHLFLAPPSDAALEQAVEQATEIGYDEIHLFRSQRVQVPKDRSLSYARLKRIMYSACKQCGRLWAPTMNESIIPFEKALEDATSFLKVFADESSADTQWGSLRGAELKKTEQSDLAIFIGPEGGWSDEERSTMKEIATTFSLGPHVLRVPTAVVAAYSLCWKELSRE
ncbi:MAG: RsmE family RNA methyltransferase [Bdellovibrionota bacterium]